MEETQLPSLTITPPEPIIANTLKYADTKTLSNAAQSNKSLRNLAYLELFTRHDAEAQRGQEHLLNL